MVELGRQPGSQPVSLGSVAEAENLPLSYLEHLVAKLRNAGLVTSTRGAHGGYRLARPAEEITMDQVVEALEGQIAPLGRFHGTRVQGRVGRALAGTTLAELVEFSGGPTRAGQTVGSAA